MPQREVRLLGPLQVRVPGIQRPPGRVATRDGGAGQLRGLGDLGRGEGGVAEQAAVRRVDAAPASRHDLRGLGRVPRRRDELRDQRRLEDEERGGHRASAHASQGRRARGEVGRAPLAHPERDELGLDLGGEVAERVQGFEGAGCAARDAGIHGSCLPAGGLDR